MDEAKAKSWTVISVKQRLETGLRQRIDLRSASQS